jgi:tripartite-type tricarboxylate transporter receptor subunit TctC
MKKFLSTLLLGMALSGAAYAEYPEKPITAIVPFPPGGSTDAIARAIGPKITQKLGQPFVVENRPGATGAIGAGMLKRAAPDGYTIMVASIGVYAVNPVLQKSLPYDPSKDFDLLTVAVRAPNVLVAPPSFAPNNVAELIAYLKKNPEKVTFASSGAGSSDHLTAALFWQQTKTSGIHVPYKGGAPAITDLLGGHADVSFQNINVVLNHIKAGKLKALAVTGDKRAAILPQVPTLAEAGVTNVDVYSWQAVAAPKGLPANVKT